MNELPKHIADLCGIITDKLEQDRIARETAQSSLKLLKDDDDDVWSVVYNDEEIGWINKITYANRDQAHYRAVSVHGAMKHTYSLALARSFVMAEYY